MNIKKPSPPQRSTLAEWVVYALLLFAAPFSFATLVGMTDAGVSTTAQLIPSWAATLGGVGGCIAVFRALKADRWIVPACLGAFVLMAMLILGLASFSPPADQAAMHGIVVTTKSLLAWACVLVAISSAFAPPLSFRRLDP